MSHRDEPRSGRGCFGAVVVVPFLALGGMFVLIALTGSPDEAPLAAPPAARPTSQWWTEPFDALTTATVTETVVLEGQARELKAARLATQTRVAVSTVTETVRTTSSSKRPATGRNEPPPADPGEEEPTVSPSATDTSAPPIVTSSVQSGPPTLEPPAPSQPTEPVTTPPTSTPRSEDPVTPTPTTPPVTPPCSSAPGDRSEPAPSEPAEPSVPSQRSEPGPSESGSSESGPSEPGPSIEATLELPLPSPAEVLSVSSTPAAGV